LKNNKIYTIVSVILILTGCSQKSIEYNQAKKASYKVQKEQYDVYNTIENQTKKIKALRRDVRSLTNEIAGDASTESDYEGMCYSQYNKYVRLSTEYRHLKPSLVYRVKQDYLRCEDKKKKLQSMEGR